jgi:stage V sporulation protein SpoVS
MHKAVNKDSSRQSYPEHPSAAIARVVRQILPHELFGLLASIDRQLRRIEIEAEGTAFVNTTRQRLREAHGILLPELQTNETQLEIPL